MTTSTGANANVSLDVFFGLVLTGLGAPVTANNINKLIAWTYAENGSNFSGGSYTGPAWNPLNIEHAYNGSSTWGPAEAKGAPVQQYTSALNGTEATVNEIQTWIPAFAPIKASLMQDSPCSSFSAVVSSTGWGTEPFNGCNTGGLTGSSSLGTDATGQIATGSAASQIASLPASVSNVAGAVAGVTGVSALGGLGTITTDLTSRAWWLRVGEFVLGLGLIVGGLVLFVATSKPGQEAISSGKQAAELAAVA